VFVMSARPGKVIAEHRIEFARPRDLKVMYEPAFNDKVQELRSQIAEARVAA
jgi:NitT/TauT family transport system ATP-binding protein